MWLCGVVIDFKVLQKINKIDGSQNYSWWMTFARSVVLQSRGRAPQSPLPGGHGGGRPGGAALWHRLRARGQGQRVPRPLVQEGLRHSYIQVGRYPRPSQMWKKVDVNPGNTPSRYYCKALYCPTRLVWMTSAKSEKIPSPFRVWGGLSISFDWKAFIDWFTRYASNLYNQTLIFWFHCQFKVQHCLFFKQIFQLRFADWRPWEQGTLVWACCLRRESSLPCGPVARCPLHQEPHQGGRRGVHLQVRRPPASTAGICLIQRRLQYKIQ